MCRKRKEGGEKKGGEKWRIVLVSGVTGSIKPEQEGKRGKGREEGEDFRPDWPTLNLFVHDYPELQRRRTHRHEGKKEKKERERKSREGGRAARLPSPKSRVVGVGREKKGGGER